MNYSARVNVMLKPGVADPQGQTIEKALPALGYSGVGNVRVGKSFVLEVEADDDTQAHALVTDMCRRLLANPVIETYEVTVAARNGSR